MISDVDHEAIAAAVAALDIDSWRPLDDAERDLVSRALAPRQAADSESRAA